MSVGDQEDRPRFLEPFSSSLQPLFCNWGAEANVPITNAVGAPPASMDLVINCFLASVALLLLGSIGAFMLCFPVLPTALISVILLGMAALFLLGFWAGNAKKVSAGYTFAQHPTEWVRDLLGQHIENHNPANEPQPAAAPRDSP